MFTFNDDFKRSPLLAFYKILSQFLIKILFISGSTRWGNEFIQSIDQHIHISNPLDSKLTLKLRTGHGRLYWRCFEALNIEPETNCWLASLTSDDILYDVGSNIGLYSLMPAQAIGLKVFSFELDLINASLQHQNIYLNHLQDSITIIPIALSDVTSLRRVFYKSISPGDALHSIDSPSPSLSNDRMRKIIHSHILTYSLNDIVRLFSLPSPTAIKIDVDGVESLILEGASDILSSVNSIMVEVDVHSSETIASLLSQYSFSIVQKYSSHGISSTNYNVLFMRSTLQG